MVAKLSVSRACTHDQATTQMPTLMTVPAPATGSTQQHQQYGQRRLAMQAQQILQVQCQIGTRVRCTVLLSPLAQALG